MCVLKSAYVYVFGHLFNTIVCMRVTGTVFGHVCVTLISAAVSFSMCLASSGELWFFLFRYTWHTWLLSINESSKKRSPITAENRRARSEVKIHMTFWDNMKDSKNSAHTHNYLDIQMKTNSDKNRIYKHFRIKKDILIIVFITGVIVKKYLFFI